MSKSHLFQVLFFSPLALVGALSLSGCASFGVPGTSAWDSSFLRDADSDRVEASAPSHRWSGPVRSDDFEEEQATGRRSVRPGDVAIGMTLTEVRETWGSPREVEFAGDSQHGNQRWIFPLGIDPRISPARVIYFERGRVVGWETVHP